MAANSRFAVATHILAALALKKGEKVSSTYLGESVNTNPVVIRRILLDLQKAGFIETITGKNGGTQLKAAPKDVSLRKIYEAVDDGSIFAYNPAAPNKKCPLSCKMKGVLAPIFQSVEQALEKDLEKVTLEDVVKKLNKE
jgi:Rrf2 family protein